MILLNTFINNIYDGENKVIEVYSDNILIWPIGPINNTGFLKYDENNMKREFPGGDIVDPNAPIDILLMYKENNFSESFLPPDTGIQNYIFHDQSMFYTSLNIERQFNQDPILGIYDQDLLYNDGNIDTEFINPPDLPDAVWDEYMVANSTNIVTFFQGPDSEAYPYNDESDQPIWYEKSNIETEFIYYVDPGEFDYEQKYDVSNIVTEFKNNVPALPDTEWDQNAGYYPSNIAISFKGPDTESIDYSDGSDQSMWYSILNMYWEFQQFPILGVMDQILLYDSGNIASLFVGHPESSVADYDQLYGLRDLPSQFLGPDPMNIDYDNGMDQTMWYNNTNFLTEFGPIDHGELDQDLVYSVSNIATQFI